MLPLDMGDRILDFGRFESVSFVCGSMDFGGSGAVLVGRLQLQTA